MKSQLFLPILLLCSITLFGMEEEFPIPQTNHGSKFDSIHMMNDNRLNLIDEKSIDQVKLSVMIEKNLPWAVALLISVASVLLNFGIAKYLRVLNEKKMQLQVETIERRLRYYLDKSLDSQLQHLKKMAIAKDKQQWVEEVNVCIANYLTNIDFVQPKVQGLLEPGDFAKYIENILLYKSKIEILLPGDTVSQRKILKTMDDFNEILAMNEQEYRDDLFEEKRNKLLKATRTFYKNNYRITV